MKPKLSIDEQIKHMKSKGILFDIMSEDSAKEFITDNTYYFKIKAYAKNYPKNTDDKYVNLEFAALHELSVLDMHLRRIILSLTLNIEHAVRTNLNRHFCTNAQEDGYSIVKSFRSSIDYQDVQSNKYTKNLVKRYDPDFAIWNYLEIISFGTLCDFYKHYYNIYDKQELKFHPLLFSCRIVRNIAAHNNCLLNNITNKTTINPSWQLTRYMGQGKHFSEKALEKLKIPVLNDFSAALYLFNHFVVSLSMRRHTYKDLHLLIERISRNINYFDKHPNIKNNLLFFEKIVDFFEKIA